MRDAERSTDAEAPSFKSKFSFRILSLDGGGSKGVYTLGVLKEFERLLGQSLATHFYLMYGTSTGAIIVALLGLGLSVTEIEKIYFELIPEVMKRKLSWTRTAELRKRLSETFGDKKFDRFLTDIGIVATNYERERPMIFKTSVSQAFKGKSSFEPGFGVTIAEALLASTAAFPFFRRLDLKTNNLGTPEVMDGGFVANNPTLFAIADALQSLGAARSAIKVLSVGVGHYSEPQKNWYSRLILNFFPFKMMEKSLPSTLIQSKSCGKYSSLMCVLRDLHPTTRTRSKISNTPCVAFPVPVSSLREILVSANLDSWKGRQPSEPQNSPGWSPHRLRQDRQGSVAEGRSAWPHHQPLGTRLYRSWHCSDARILAPPVFRDGR
jgi:uncharacterized protein